MDRARQNTVLESIMQKKLDALQADYDATIAAEKPVPDDNFDKDDEGNDEQPAFQYQTVTALEDEFGDYEGGILNSDPEDDHTKEAEHPEELNEEDETEATVSKTAPQVLQPISHDKKEYIKEVMRGLNLKAPDWATRIPEEIWLGNLLGKMPSNSGTNNQEQSRSSNKKKKKKKKKKMLNPTKTDDSTDFHADFTEVGVEVTDLP